MNVVFTPTAWQQYTDWQKEDKKIVKRINELIKSIDRDGLLEGIGKPEPLKHRKVCSRRITDEHRLTYNFDSNKNLVQVLFFIVCISASSHTIYHVF